MQNSNMILSIIFVFILFFSCNADEFVYPVGYCTQKNMLFYQYQQTPSDLSLFAYDFLTREHIKLLSSFFTPVGFRLLPDHAGFSFIQNDSVYVKYFNKRSPKRIEFYEPIYGINSIEWIDNSLFYFAAREHGKYRIYRATLEGDVDCLVKDEKLDLLYPQKINNSLFYIARNDNSNYSIMHNSFDNPKNAITLCRLNSASACLCMSSEVEGFFLSYCQQVKKEGGLLDFEYYKLVLSDAVWKTELLFTFSLPLDFFSDQSAHRVYESVIPFLPRYYNDNIYFVDYEVPEQPTLKRYGIKEKKITKVREIPTSFIMPGIFSREKFEKVLKH